LKIQRAAASKIRDILNDPTSKGDIDTFYIAAVDSLDCLSAYEIWSRNKKNI